MTQDTDLTADQTRTLTIINDVFAILSFLGCAAIMAFFAKTWNLWTYSGKMIVCLVFSNLVYAITNLFILFDPSMVELCGLDGFLRTFAMLCSFYWATRISLVAYRAVVSEYYDPSKSDGYWIGFFGPMVIAIIPLFQFKFVLYDNIGLSCDIDSYDPNLQIVWLVLFLLVPMFIGMFLTSYYCIRIMKFLKGYEQSLEIHTRHFLAYPLGLIIAWLPSMIFRIVYLSGYYSVWLDGLNIAFSRSSGLINAIIYGWQSFAASKPAATGESEESAKPILGSHTFNPETYGALGDLEEKEEIKIKRRAQTLRIY